MAGIPLVLDTDVEDVIWALQTADTLWKRGERVDAIVWLRRAAQAAGEAENDDRALSLARDAAELSEWLTQNPSPTATRSAPPPPQPPTPGEAVDQLLRDSAEPQASTAHPHVIPSRPVPASDNVPAAQSTSVPTVERERERVPSAAELHAGMLDPWAEAPKGETPAAVPKPAPPAKGPPPPPRVQPLAAPPPPAAAQFDADEVITSAPPIHPAASLSGGSRAAERVDPSVSSVGSDVAAPVAVEARPQPASQPPMPPQPGLNLVGVEAFADLPDDARDSFAKAASVRTLMRDEEVSGFALAFVIDGSVDLCATIVDAPAERLSRGSVLRARGTVGTPTSLRLVAASERATLAIWGEDAVEEAFRACPWVEDELRASGDRFQALVGATMGPLGERLDSALRASVTGRLRLQALGEHEVFAARGEAIPGLLVVGAGELELVSAEGVPSGTVHTGEFLFPKEVLRAAPAPETVRASQGGALVLVADRRVAQELLLTCPPLLEIFAD